MSALTFASYLGKWAHVRMRHVFWQLVGCPKCGKKLSRGFGLAGGGFGPYVFCEAPACGYFFKRHTKDESWE